MTFHVGWNEPNGPFHLGWLRYVDGAPTGVTGGGGFGRKSRQRKYIYTPGEVEGELIDLDQDDLGLVLLMTLY